MFDNNWELINGEEAHGIEVLNQSSVVNLIEATVKFLNYHDNTTSVECSLAPIKGIINEFHRTGTTLLLKRPGDFRSTEVAVYKIDNTIFYPPNSTLVNSLMDHFQREIDRMWSNEDYVSIAAYALWRINWIHPFKNGNGRSARAYAYTCICLKFGKMLPGSVTLIDLITQNREDYEAALHHADVTYAETRQADLLPLKSFVEKLIRIQLLDGIQRRQEAEAANTQA